MTPAEVHEREERMRKLRRWAEEIEATGNAAERDAEIAGLREAADAIEVEILKDVACNVADLFKGEEMDEFERSVWRR